jgi:hypothetical protein
MTRYFSICILAASLAACGGGGAGQNAGLPLSQAPGAPPVPQASGAVAAASPGATPQAAFPNANLIAFEGEISALRSGGYTMEGTAGQGYLHINTTSSTTLNIHGGSATVGHYALLVGSGSVSTAISAVYIATFTSAPGQVTVQGTYSQATPYGFEMKTTDYGIVPVMTSTATSLSGTLVTGGAITVQGTGSGNDAILAASVASAGTSTTSPATISQVHVPTADYLESPDGTTTVTPAQAAPHLNWAETGVANTPAIYNAGIKTMVYFDMDRLVPDDSLYAQLSGSEYEETCSGARISDYQDDVTQYVTNPASSAMRSAVDAYVTAATKGYPVDAIFEDDADPLSEYPASYFSPGSPCDYSDSAWIAGEEALLAGYDHDTFVNGFSNMTQAAPIPNTTQLLANASTIGGNMESCYVRDASPIEEGSWVWTGTENTSLLVTGEGKYFECWAMDYGAASSEIASRIYALASFLMTYNPTYSIFREGYATPSGLHVMPESQLVPMQPVVAQPSNVSTLDESYVYVREYHACYYDGKLVGQCAMVVNNDTAPHPTPALALTYHHTLTLSGEGILDGGSVGFAGAAPPASVPALSAFIAMP